jgi:hypothetical protein
LRISLLQKNIQNNFGTL